jgi:hypothetical protein
VLSAVAPSATAMIPALSRSPQRANSQREGRTRRNARDHRRHDTKNTDSSSQDNCHVAKEIQLVTGEGRPFPPRLAQEITREIGRLGLLQRIAAIEHERGDSPTTCKDTKKKRALLLLLGGIGPTSSAVMAREVY